MSEAKKAMQNAAVPATPSVAPSYLVEVIEGTTLRGTFTGSDGKAVPRTFAAVQVTIPGNRSRLKITTANAKVLTALGVTGAALVRINKACADADSRNAKHDAAYDALKSEAGIATTRAASRGTVAKY